MYWKGLTQKESPHLMVNSERDHTLVLILFRNINKGQIDVIALSDLRKNRGGPLMEK